jgi:sugar phosphate isomerase/epimerase
MHGGAAPQVKRSAHERLAEMVDPLLTELFRIARSGDSDTVRLAAIKDALDRAGYKANSRLELTGKDGGPIDLNVEPADRIARRIAELAARVGADRVSGEPAT